MWKKNIRKLKTVSLLLKIISAHLNAYVDFVNSRQRPPKNSVQFDRHFFSLHHPETSFLWGQFSPQETEIAIKKTETVLTSLVQLLAWCESPLLLLIRASGVRTFCKSSSSVNLHEGFDKSSSYWRLVHIPSFWEPIDHLMAPSDAHLPLCPHFERLKDAGFLEHPQDPVFKSFKLLKYTATTSRFISTGRQ
jgi:hypothetical protein